MYNTIVASNYAKEYDADVYGELASGSANNLIGFDPKFVVGPVFDAKGKLTNADLLDRRLTAASWAIDRGANAYLADVATDLAGNARKKRSWASTATVDIGAYEYQTTLAKTPETPSLVVTTNLDVVDDTDGLISLREAIWLAEADSTLGDTISFAASLKGKTITLSGLQLKIARAGLTVDATSLYDAENDVPGVTIDADGKSCVFYLTGGEDDAPITLKGLTLTGGYASGKGGAVLAPSSTNVELCVFANNVAKDCGGAFDSSNFSERGYSFVSTKFIDNYAGRDGGAVGLLGTRGAFVDCVFEGNESAGVGGALSVHKMELTVSGTRFSNNVAADGGALYLRSNGALTDCVFEGNEAATDGGAIYVASTGWLTATGLDISNGSASYGGGAIHVAESGTATVANSTFVGNGAAWGGALHVVGSLTAVDVTVSGNSASNDGGVNVDAKGTLTLTDSLVDSNKITAGYVNVYGGGICANGTLTVENSTITNNVANGVNDAFGGGIYAAKSLTILNSNVSNNLATGKFAVRGGGVASNGTLVAIDSTFDGNVATHATDDWAARGGGIYFGAVEGTATLTNCVVSNNSASNDGGGVYSTSSAYFANVLIVGNDGACGGAFYGKSGTAIFANATLTGNAAATGGGLYVVDGAATLYNSIVALNKAKTGGADVAVDGSKTTVEARNTLSSFTDWTNANAAGVVNYVYDAKLPLFNDAANGDYSLAENSQALDKGNDAYAVDAQGNALTTDLAGAPRFAGKAVDLGPYEFGPFAPVAPTNVKFGPYDAASKTATLTWTDNATNETRYEARFSVDGGATWTTLANLAANATSRVCDDLNVGETYVFQIRAVAANGLASDWESAKFLVSATFGASAYVVEQNCAFYLSTTGANDGALSYYWDLSGSEVEETSNFIERESGFWANVEELGVGVGERTIRMRCPRRERNLRPDRYGDAARCRDGADL